MHLSHGDRRHLLSQGLSACAITKQLLAGKKHPSSLTSIVDIWVSIVLWIMRIRVVLAELDCLDFVGIRDAWAREIRHYIDEFEAMCVRPVGSEFAPTLTLPEGTITPNSLSPDGDSASLDITCHLRQDKAAASDLFVSRTYVAHPASTLVAAEDGVM